LGHKLALTMGPLIRNKLFSYIDEHIDTSWEQWLQLQTIVEAASSTGSQQMLQATLVALLQEAGMQPQVFALPPIAIYGVSAGENPQTLLLYLPIYRSHHLLPLVYSLTAVKAYQATTGRIPITVKWLLDFGDGRQLTKLVARDHAFLQANGCLWYSEEQGGETDPQFALGTKGNLCVELRSHTGRIAAPTMHASVLPNALWRLLWAVNSLKNAHEHPLIEGFYDTVKPLADNLTAMLYELYDNAQPFAQLWGQTPLMGLRGLQFHYAHLLTPTCTIGNITDNAQLTTKSTGSPCPTLPTQATVQLEFLLVPEQDPQDIFDKLRTHLQMQGFADIEVHLLDSSRPLSTDWKHPFVEVISQSRHSIYERSSSYMLPLSAGSYPLAPLRLTLDMPVILDLLPTPPSEADISAKILYMAQQIKQMVLIMDRFTQIP
jgi:hypothetical protein